MSHYSGSVLKDKSEVEFILENLDLDKIMVEWGSGYGTLFFSNYVKKYYSIEHNKVWYDKIVKEYRPNLKVFLAPQQDGVQDRIHEDKNCDWEYVLETKYAKGYSEYIERFSSITEDPDLVLIDGRARTACAKYIHDKIKRTCKVIIHDWNRKHYKRVLDSYQIIKQSHKFSGIALLEKR